MKYFENFPKIIITNVFGEKMLATNIIARVNIVPNLLENPLIFYNYDIQDNDKPDTIASKYYNNPYRYWIFLYGNNIMDPLSSLPLSTNEFTIYMQDKYTAPATELGLDYLQYTQETVLQYQKIYNTTDSDTGEMTSRTYNIDSISYNELPDRQLFENNLDDGTTVTIEIIRQTVTIYDYEDSLNESKRSVNIINNIYAADLENQLRTLLKR